MSWTRKNAAQDALGGTKTPKATGTIRSRSGVAGPATGGLKPAGSTVPSNRSRSSQSGVTAPLKGGESPYIIVNEDKQDQTKGKGKAMDDLQAMIEKRIRADAKKRAKKARKTQLRKTQASRPVSRLELLVKTADLGQQMSILKKQVEYDQETDPVKKQVIGNQLTFERLKRLHQTGLGAGNRPAQTLIPNRRAR